MDTLIKPAGIFTPDLTTAVCQELYENHFHVEDISSFGRKNDAIIVNHHYFLQIIAQSGSSLISEYYLAPYQSHNQIYIDRDKELYFKNLEVVIEHLKSLIK